MTKLSAAVVLSALACAACAGASAGRARADAPAADSTAVARAAVLASLVGQPLVIAPIQRLRVVAGAPSWAPEGAAARTYLAALDDEIAAALADRGVARGWVLPEQVVRAARRNPTLAGDPHALSVEPLLPRGQTAGRGGGAGVGTDLLDPLRSELRAITALTEDARYVLVPAELRFERAAGDGATSGGVPDAARGRAVLYLAVIDTRLARVGWVGEVASDDATSLSPAVAASLADRVANLAAPPP